jgi:hypothetical protein
MVSNFQDSSPLDNCPDASGDDLEGDSKMNSSQVPSRGRPIKFTPGRIQQITNLVERGKSPEEIAELIEVTINSLQVTCSRLGISLRRPKLNNGIRLLPPGKPVPSNGRTTPDLSCDVSVPLQPITERRQDSQPGPEQTQYTTPHQAGSKAKEVNFANLALTMRYKGEERTTELALTQLAIGQLALEAGLRDMSIGELVGELLTATIQKNLFQRALDLS